MIFENEKCKANLYLEEAASTIVDMTTAMLLGDVAAAPPLQR